MAINDRRTGTVVSGSAVSQASARAAALQRQQLVAAKAARAAQNKKDKRNRAPATIQASVGDDWNALASKLGVDVQDVVTANPNDTSVKGGVVYNAPRNIPQGVGVGAGAGSDWFLNQLKEFGQMVSPWDESSGETFQDWASNLPGGKGAWDWINWGNKKDDEVLSSGSGQGGVWVDPRENRPGGTGKYGTSSAPNTMWGGGPTTQQQALAQNFLGNIGTQNPEMYPQQWNYNQPAQPGPLRPGQAMANAYGFASLPVGAGQFQPPSGPGENMAFAYGLTDIPRNEALNWARPTVTTTDQKGFVDPRGNRPMQEARYTSANDDAVAQLKRDWEETYLDPANKGRGAGIAGWIEERGGFDNMRQDELDYLVSHGFLVPEDGSDLGDYSGGGYGSGSYGGGYNYPTPSYSSGYGGQAAQQRNIPSYLGLVSWSI